MSLQIHTITRFNWEEAIHLELHQDQINYMPSILYSIAQSKFESVEPIVFLLDNLMIGFGMFGHFSNYQWITRIMIDKKYQGFGYGQEALQLMLNKIFEDIRITEVRTSVVTQNTSAIALFKKNKFEIIGENQGEYIMSLEKWK